MQDHKRISITVQALKEMTLDQLDAIQTNIVGDGKWESAHSIQITNDLGTMMCKIRDSHDDTIILIGVEVDGYTHS